MRIELSEVDLHAIRNAVSIHGAILRVEIAQCSDRDLRASLRAEMDCLEDVALRIGRRLEPEVDGDAPPSEEAPAS